MFKGIKRTAFAGITAGLVALFTVSTPASSAVKVSADCKRVAVADRGLCHRVELQHPYGAFLGTDKDPGGWTSPGGKAIVREITHQGLTKAEMHDYLLAEIDSYRLWVTGVPVNMDEIKRKCGDTNGSWVVGFRNLNGVKATYKRVVCA